MHLKRQSVVNEAVQVAVGSCASPPCAAPRACRTLLPMQGHVKRVLSKKEEKRESERRGAPIVGWEKENLENGKGGGKFEDCIQHTLCMTKRS